MSGESLPVVHEEYLFSVSLPVMLEVESRPDPVNSRWLRSTDAWKA